MARGDVATPRNIDRQKGKIETRFERIDGA